MHGQQFTPYYNQTTSVASSAGLGTLAVPARAPAVLLTNVGNQLVFARVRTPGGAQNATVADLPLPAGTQRVIMKAADPMGGTDGEVTISIFGTGAGSTIYATPGEVPGR